MHRFTELIYQGSKMQIFLLTFLFIPIYLRTSQILNLWLGSVPEYTEQYVLALIWLSLIYAATCPIITGALATGRIRNFLLITDCIYVAGIIAIYFMGRLTGNPIAFAIAMVAVEFLIACSRIYFFCKISEFKFSAFFTRTILPSILVGVFSFFILAEIEKFLPDSLAGLIELLVISTLIILVLIYFAGINRKERLLLNNKILSYINRR
jgi:hypothetical protein